ncbi:MAG: AHH domain-containing protein [Deltaproteobacteria bacterium]|nr:AHH domain-containing protein [Deltaproteobacteria bacterium]
MGRALEAAGHSRPANSAAHHIVAGSAAAAEPARRVLNKLGIGIDDATNGIFLPMQQHDMLHTTEYYSAINKALQGVSTRQQAMDVLEAIAQKLRNQKFP